MALVAADWEVTAAKVITYIGSAHATAGAGYVTVLELHRWLQDLSDNETISGDDYASITIANPTDKKFDTIIQLVNGFTLDEVGAKPAPEFIYGGTIIQGSGGTEKIWDGISVIANPGCVVNVIQNNVMLSNAFWNNNHKGTAVKGINPDTANGLSSQFMVQIRTGGAYIDNASLIFTTREWGKTFSEFRIPSTGRGKNSVPLTYATDLNNQTLIATIAALADITNVTAGFNLIDVDNNAVNEQYYSEWDRGANSINTFYEYMKWLTRAGYTTTLYGIPGEKFRGITHEIVVDGQGATDFSAVETVTWATGSGRMLAINDVNAATKMWIQLLTGIAPVNDQVITGSTSTATCAANVTITTRDLSTPMCGQSTGSSLVGAYGFSLEYADLAVNDKITALDNTTRQPPNNVTFTVSGLQSGWRVLVGPEDGAGGLDYDQLTLNGALSGAAVTSVVVNEILTDKNIPAVATGYGGIRILRADGSYTLHAYTAVNTGTKTFTIPAHDFSSNAAANGANAFVSYLDLVANATSEAFSTIQSGANQTLFVAARFGGTGPDYTDSIKPAATTGTLGSTGGSATISSVSDA